MSFVCVHPCVMLCFGAVQRLLFAGFLIVSALILRLRVSSAHFTPPLQLRPRRRRLRGP